MDIKEYNLDVDILEELQNFEWVGEVIKGIKFIACSPFRSERHPSFACNLETGTFIDSGNSDEFYHKGNLVKLLAALRNEDYETIEDYLIEKYATILADTEALELHLNLYGEEEKPLVIERTDIKHLYTHPTDYFTNRGISLEVQRLFGLGFNSESGTVAMLWTDSHNSIVNIKYRKVAEKVFFYEKGGQPIKNYVYGIYQCIMRKAKRVYICESEIDALTLWTYGLYAIAVGGSSLSDNQKQIILSAGIEELVIATDNDIVGKRFMETLKINFEGILTILFFPFPHSVKDVNDMSKEQITKASQTLTQPTLCFISLVK